ncbi:MAG: FeS-binding protein, partial [Flavobacteriaceae bacterium CG_4_8_14_3_um_filter_31_8]
MKVIKQIGLGIFLVGFSVFTSAIFSGYFNFTQQELDSYVSEKGYKSERIKEELLKSIVTDEKLSILEFSSKVRAAFEISNNYHNALISKYSTEKNWAKKSEEFQYKISGKPHNLSFEIAKKAGKGFFKDQPTLAWWLTFGLGIFGALLFILPNAILLGKPGIKNDGIYHESATNRGFIAWLVLIYLVTFYLLLYFMPDYVVNWTFIFDPISKALNGGNASQWFVYG